MRMRTLTTAWLAATAAAAAISWAGVNLVLREAVFGPPDAVFVPARPGAIAGALPPVSTPAAARSTGRATPAPGATVGLVPSGPVPSGAAPTTPSASRSPRATAGVTTTPSAPPPAAAPEGADSRGYTVRGGRVALALGRDSATLISASPGPGWAVQTWRTETWLRVDFTKDGRTSSVFATWNGHAPLVETYEQ
ncbi:hypothetical protein ACIRBX_03255 [Kitasatospora sp. NPDC096147]|uniref:hypothetical protein n=1 Tax=Kitasatospora sp. NPDC096147 TaxID=3364093 RepID=UPI003805043D